MKKLFIVLSAIVLVGCMNSVVHAMESLNAQLIKAVRANDDEKVSRLLRQGANANLEIRGQTGENTVLELAAGNGFARITESLLEYGADANKEDEYGETALHLAAGRGHLATARLLIAYRADVNKKNRVGRTPLRIALRYRRAEMAQLLQENGAY